MKQPRDFFLAKFNLEALAGSVAWWTPARAWTSWFGCSQKCTDQQLDYIITGSLLKFFLLFSSFFLHTYLD